MASEAFPKLFDQNKRRPASKRFFMPGFTGNYILLLWSVMGMVIALAFFSVIRTMLRRPVYEKTIDSTKDLVLAGKIPITGLSNAFWENYLRDSSNV